MKTFYILLISISTIFTSVAQDITGKWNGILKVSGAQLELIFHITKTENGFSATLDIPDQGARGIPVTNTTYDKPKIKFEIATIRVEYDGELSGNEITGIFRQNGQEFPLKLSRKKMEKEAIRRPQEPTKPYPYHSEDIQFQNPDANITLAGTLSFPKKGDVFPAVILISGSGPQNRNEELLDHKPFLIIADYLTKNGIAVLRYDDRGVAASEGKFNTATSADFATDVESAIAYLKTRKEINPNKIGLIGHSEGGLIAPMVAAKSKDINFIILLAGPGIPGGQILILQQELIARASGISEDTIKESSLANKKIFEMVNNSKGNLKDNLRILLDKTLQDYSNSKIPNGMSKEEFIAQQIQRITTPWMRYFIKYNPATALEKVTCPVLALSGDKDLQVPPKENLIAIKDALAKGGNKNVTTKTYPNLNHLFQECKTGLPSEYRLIEQTFSPIVLEDLIKWIALQTD